MSVSNPTIAAFFNTDVEFRAWAQAIHDAISGAGLVQTADTGQINLATIPRPAAINTAQGYEIWRFADALQATSPIFIKIEYGSGASVAGRPALWFTVGRGTDGAGNITNGNTRQQIASATTDTAGTTRASWITGDTSRIAGLINDGTTSTAFFFLIERGKDSSGTKQGDVTMTVLADNAVLSGARAQAIYPSGSHPTAVTINSSNPGICHPGSAGGASAFGDDVCLFPWIVPKGKPYFLSAVGKNTADIPTGGTFTATYLGASHTFLSLPVQVTGLPPHGASGGAWSSAILWE